MTRVRTLPNRFILKVARRFGRRAKEVERFLKFALVGALGAVVDLMTLFALQATVLPPHHPANVAVATTLAFFTAVIHNFLWNRFWTYPDSRSRSARRQMAQFTVISGVGWVIRTVWISLAYAPLGDALMPLAMPFIHMARPEYVASATAAHKLGTLVATLIGIGVIVNWNFLANRFWTYNDVDKLKETAEAAV
jgi:putative flippase GtrA